MLIETIRAVKRSDTSHCPATQVLAMLFEYFTTLI
jgi:hypothetical protein